MAPFPSAPLPDTVSSAAAEDPFDEAEYKKLREYYVEKRLLWSKELTEGLQLRPRPKEARIDTKPTPGFKAVRKRINELESEENHREIFSLLCRLREHAIPF